MAWCGQKNLVRLDQGRTANDESRGREFESLPARKSSTDLSAN